MRCGHCTAGTMRLVRFESGREIWKCRQCGVESISLDCALCEQRAVRRMPDRHDLARWACSRCQVDQYPCPACEGGWIRNLDASGWRCDRCGTPNPDIRD